LHNRWHVVIDVVQGNVLGSYAIDRVLVSLVKLLQTIATIGYRHDF